ncbi:hypothetical protein [Flavobacterium algicola]|nr:hypothetical protein [Flavobacterium algicola]MCG9791333.1 hypothetical protein [Flavobacterium algicola]
MTKKQILIVIATFLFGFGSAFFVIKTFFPKQKVENVKNKEVKPLAE